MPVRKEPASPPAPCKRLDIPDVPPSLNVLMRLHWRNQYTLRKKWNLWVRAQMNGNNHLRGAVKVRVTVTLFHARPYDQDNAVGACKVLVDALKDWRLIYDDTKKYLDLQVKQEFCAHRKRHTVVELEGSMTLSEDGAGMSELTFKDFSRTNRLRCEAATGFNHQLSSWSTSDWFTALVGELGEAANIAKKLNRYRDGIPGNKVSREELQSKLRQELGDVFVYLDLLAQSVDVLIGEAAVEVFNAKSQELGCPILFVEASRERQRD